MNGIQACLQDDAVRDGAECAPPAVVGLVLRQCPEARASRVAPTLFPPLSGYCTPASHHHHHHRPPHGCSSLKPRLSRARMRPIVEAPAVTNFALPTKTGEWPLTRPDNAVGVVVYRQLVPGGSGGGMAAEIWGTHIHPLFHPPCSRLQAAQADAGHQGRAFRARGLSARLVHRHGRPRLHPPLPRRRRRGLLACRGRAAAADPRRPRGEELDLQPVCICPLPPCASSLLTHLN